MYSILSSPTSIKVVEILIISSIIIIPLIYFSIIVWWDNIKNRNTNDPININKVNIKNKDIQRLVYTKEVFDLAFTTLYTIIDDRIAVNMNNKLQSIKYELGLLNNNISNSTSTIDNHKLSLYNEQKLNLLKEETKLIYSTLSVSLKNPSSTV